MDWASTYLFFPFFVDLNIHWYPVCTVGMIFLPFQYDFIFILGILFGKQRKILGGRFYLSFKLQIFGGYRIFLFLWEHFLSKTDDPTSWEDAFFVKSDLWNFDGYWISFLFRGLLSSETDDPTYWEVFLGGEIRFLKFRWVLKCFFYFGNLFRQKWMIPHPERIFLPILICEFSMGTWCTLLGDSFCQWRMSHHQVIHQLDGGATYDKRDKMGTR